MARGRAKQDPDTPDDTRPEFASVEGSQGEPIRGPRVRPVKRARVGVVVLTVLVVEILLIGAGLNQGVSKHLESYSADHPSSLLGHVMRSLLILRWQVAASGHSDLWHTELITVGLVLLLGIVLVPMVVHGPVSWLRAFLGIWFTVTVSVAVSAVAAIVLADLEESRDLTRYVIPGTPSTGLSIGNKISGATFGPVLSYAFVAGLALGLVVALITATVVVATRRTDPVPVAVAADLDPASNPENPQPFFGNSVEDDRPTRASSGYGTDRYPSSDSYAGSGSYASAGSYADSHPYAAPDRRATEETTTLPATPGPDAPTNSEAPTSSEAPGTGDATATSELPRTEAVPDEATQAWPAQPPSESESESESEPESTPAATGSDSQPTAAFPLPPDDEDLGHHPDRQDD